ncbi:Uncharacterized protein FKW44_002319 [Caligus rogercresseyi]|uniref:Cuticle protein 8 n=1 Tax=Caligus rogercresseyi TaxID=217165 RepID=A0A7T8KK28_CALRO|nr:Uncharacterized protein FKW44_002319 [Caligus rogercresseyi]
MPPFLVTYKIKKTSNRVSSDTNACSLAFIISLHSAAQKGGTKRITVLRAHQTIQHGHAVPVHTSIHKPMVQPAADPSDVHNPYLADHKPIAAVHAPAHHLPTTPLPITQLPTTLPRLPIPPSPHRPQACSLPPCPVVHKPAPYHPAPSFTSLPLTPAPVHKSPYHEESYDHPAVYQYGYAVADDYAKTNFAQNENRDGYATSGEYRVALPDGRTQIVSYKVDDAYSGYVADVRYEGEAHYEPYTPEHKPAPYHPAPAPYHA